MQIVSHYSNVPVTTSNVATDSVRTDNQQKPPLLPPQEPGKNHQQRGLEQRQERATEQQQERLDRIAQRGTRHQQQQGDQQQGENQKQLPEGQKAALMKLATQNGGLSRRDVRDRTQMLPQLTSTQEPSRSSLFPNEAPGVYRQIGAVIANHYQQSSETRPEPSLNISL